MIIMIMLLLLLYTTRTKTHAQNTHNEHSSRREQRLSLFRKDDEIDGDNIPPRSHMSVSLSHMSVFFPSIKQTTEKKFISLSVIETRHIYLHTERRKEDEGICAALQNAFVVVLVVARTFFNI